jgi:hypothetical protein
MSAEKEKAFGSYQGRQQVKYQIDRLVYWFSCSAHAISTIAIIVLLIKGENK